MSGKVSLPKIDPRKANDVLRQLRRMVPHYTMEWAAKDDADPGVGLLKVFAFIAEGVISRLNRAPERNLLAFLDMLGIRLLPATPARVPVRFLLAKGTETAFLVPTGTQVSAAPNATRLTETPFETIDNLWAIPANLKALFSVDPAKDHIYKPPPKFLELELAATDLPLLEVTAFSSPGSKFLQLAPPDLVKKDEFLRIEQALDPNSRTKDCLPVTGKEQSPSIDHLVALLDAKGTIVTVTDPLPRDYAEGTTVKRVTDFELFEGKNWQEHILYLAHAAYFSIKSEAQIELLVELAGATANLDALDVIWEFFGDTETIKEERWHRFEIDLDGTMGLTRSGRVILNKPAGEIKEKEIYGSKSRWIRARLDKPLPSIPEPSLPTIESLFFKVTSKGEGLEPDHAFHNDTPLTTDVEFFPFGTEPRIFDRFSIASEEAFSKPGAEIDLAFTLDTSDLLASPAGIVTQNKIRVFAVAPGGKLREFLIDPAISEVVAPDDHGSPKETRIAAGSVPAVVTDTNENFVGVFVKTDDGIIHQRFISALDSDDSTWRPLSETPGELQFDPAAIRIGGEFQNWQVFAVADNRLYVSNQPMSPADASPWHPYPDKPKINSTPFVLDSGGSPEVFVTDVDGKTWMSKNEWTVLTPTLASGAPNPEYLAVENARPFARSYLGDKRSRQFVVYLRNRRNELVVLDSVAGRSRNLGKPNLGVGSNPFGSSLSGDDRIYVRDIENNHLWSIKDSPGEEWTYYGTTNEINLDGDPFVIASPEATGDFISAFSTSKKNALLEYRAAGKSLAEGKLQAGPRDIIVLAEELPDSETYYIRIIFGPGASSSGDAVRRIKQQLTSDEFVVLESPLDESVTDETEYELLREVASGDVVEDATGYTLTLDGDGGHVNVGDFVFAKNQLRTISADWDGSDVLIIERPWNSLPTLGEAYVLLKFEDLTGQVTDPSAFRAVLDPSVTDPGDTFDNKFLQIRKGPGQSTIGRKITDYLSSSNSVILETEFSEPPTSASEYAISVSSISEAWHTHKVPDKEKLRPELSWEYFNGRGWLALAIDEDETEKLLTEGSIKFKIPADITKTEVAGQENFWIRARIVGGDYGRELVTSDDEGKITVEKDPIRPPLIKDLSIKYKITEQKPPETCLTFNNLSYLDQTAANITEDKHFKPYVTLEDKGKAVYFGFDNSFEGGPVRLYFAAKELEVDERNKPKLAWEFGSENTFKSLPADDGTDAFTKPEFVSLVLPDGFQNTQEFGSALYWLRATLTEGKWTGSPLFRGVFPNTVETFQARTVLNEILGTSTGVKNQKFRFQQAPVIKREEARVKGEEPRVKGEEVRVREALTAEERELLSTGGVDDAILDIKDQRGDVIQTWVRWTEVVEFYDSKSDSRHYRLDRATGEIEFGDGVHGRIPPAGGDNIQAFAYQTGGGASGNVAAGEITDAVTAVAGVDSVINPTPAGGGSDAATNEDMMEIGPAQISHRERAVTPEDFELLARQASREVRKALCLPNRNPAGRHELGWTSVHIVPDSKDDQPIPTLELRRAVKRFLEKCADVTLVDQGHINVGPAKYVPVNVEVTVFAKSIDVAATAEQTVARKLKEFLHPLTGGPAGQGWDFGRDLAASDLYSLLEDIDDVDHVGSLRLKSGDLESEERVEVDSSSLIASGTHAINMSVATENR